MEKQFDWARLGDIHEGRENLGDEMPVIVYRLLQYTMLDELDNLHGLEAAQGILKHAGFRAGLAFAENVLEKTDSFNAFIADLQNKLKGLKIGILRFEKADLENMKFVLTVSEDLDCSGLPVTGDTVCAYDEGFIAGIFESYTGREFDVEEIDCWATGDRTCRFTAHAK